MKRLLVLSTFFLWCCGCSAKNIWQCVEKQPVLASEILLASEEWRLVSDIVEDMDNGFSSHKWNLHVTQREPVPTLRPKILRQKGYHGRVEKDDKTGATSLFLASHFVRELSVAIDRHVMFVNLLNQILPSNWNSHDKPSYFGSEYAGHHGIEHNFVLKGTCCRTNTFDKTVNIKTYFCAKSCGYTTRLKFSIARSLH